jgi:hypothetical protein
MNFNLKNMGVEQLSKRAIESAENSFEAMEKRQSDFKITAENMGLDASVAEHLFDAFTVLQAERGWDPYGVDFERLNSPDIIKLAAETKDARKLAEQIDGILKMRQAA